MCKGPVVGQQELRTFEELKEDSMAEIQRAREAWWGNMRTRSGRALDALLRHCQLIFLYNIHILQRQSTRSMLHFPSWERGEASAQTHFCLTSKPVSSLLPNYLPLQFPLLSQVRCFTRNINYKSNLCFYIVSLHMGIQYLCLYKNRKEQNRKDY